MNVGNRIMYVSVGPKDIELLRILCNKLLAILKNPRMSSDRFPVFQPVILRMDVGRERGGWLIGLRVLEIFEHSSRRKTEVLENHLDVGLEYVKGHYAKLTEFSGTWYWKFSGGNITEVSFGLYERVSLSLPGDAAIFDLLKELREFAIRVNEQNAHFVRNKLR